MCKCSESVNRDIRLPHWLLGLFNWFSDGPEYMRWRQRSNVCDDLHSLTILPIRSLEDSCRIFIRGRIYDGIIQRMPHSKSKNRGVLLPCRI